MKALLTAFGISLACCPLFAVFSAFELVTPNSEDQDYHPKVELIKIENEQYLLRISNVRNHAWLVSCKEELKKEKNFRSIIWKATSDAADIPHFWTLEPNIEHLELITQVEVRENQIELILSQELASRSYIAIDYRTPVDDGGYYYTIDIPAFTKQI